MKDKLLFLSKFAHFFTKTSVTACYNSLRMMPVYIPTALLPSIKKFENGADPKNLLLSLNGEARDAFPDAIKALKNAKVLVQNLKEDTKVIEYFMGLLGKPYPHLVYFVLTEKCNLRCSYCFIKNREPTTYKKHNMTPDVASKGLDFFCRLIAEDPRQFELEKTIVFYGGEPLINWKVFEMLLDKISEYKARGKLPKKTTLNLVTNGTLLNKNIAEKLKRHGVQVSISIDGDDFATNSNRIYENGGPVYEDVRRSFKICKELDMNVGASCTLSEASIENFDTTIKVLIDECGVTNLGLNLMITNGQKTVEGYNEKAAKFIIDAFKIFRTRGVYEDRIRRKANAFIERNVWPFDCGAAGGNQIVITPDGCVGVCHGFIAKKKYFPTSVFDDNFDISKDQTYQEWSMRSPLNMPECQNCPALGICGGGCPFQAKIEKGSIWNLDERFCVHAKMTLEWLIWDLFEQVQT